MTGEENFVRAKFWCAPRKGARCSVPFEVSRAGERSGGRLCCSFCRTSAARRSTVTYKSLRISRARSRPQRHGVSHHGSFTAVPCLCSAVPSTTIILPDMVDAIVICISATQTTCPSTTALALNRYPRRLPARPACVASGIVGIDPKGGAQEEDFTF